MSVSSAAGSKRLFIYNPHTDFARADDSANYTPKSKIVDMACRDMLTQLPFASPGDLFLIPFPGKDVEAEIYDTAKIEGCAVIGWDNLKYLSFDGLTIEPWGWDSTLRKRLLRFGVPTEILPDESYISRIRSLSHRRTSIHFHKLLKSAGLHKDIELPVELFSAEEVKAWLHFNHSAFLKAPWSSSGRGVWPTANGTYKEAVQWAAGIIARQGSVMAEVAMPDNADFATEWIAENGRVRFLGYSLFNTSGRAVYKGNSKMSQSEILAMLKLLIKYDPEYVADVQSRILEELIAPDYSGRLGVDMLASENGDVNACIEINLRTTMGHIAIAETEKNAEK